MFIHPDDEIAKDIEVMEESTGQFIKQVKWVDFANNEFAISIYNERGYFLQDEFGIVTKIFRRKIIPVYKGK